MPINVTAPQTGDPKLNYVLREILRRGVDGTVKPYFNPLNVINTIFGATSGNIDPFWVNMVSGFNMPVSFYDNVRMWRNLCITGDVGIGGLLRAGVIRAPGIIVDDLTIINPLPSLNIAGAVVANNFRGNFNQLIYTVAPSGASAAVKSRADYVGDGVNDQVAIHNAAVAASGSGASGRVLVLPGTYNFSAQCDISGGYYVFDAKGCYFNGPGSGANTFYINGGSGSTFNFGTIHAPGSGAAIKFDGNLGNCDITFETLVGTAQAGNGILFNCTSGMSNNHVFGFSITAFGTGINCIATASRLEAFYFSINFIYNCNFGVQESFSGAGGLVDSNIWDLNIDVSTITNAVGFSTAAAYDVLNLILGGLASGSKNVVLNSGAKQNILNLTPLYLAQTTNSIVDNSGRTDNMVNVGMAPALLAGTQNNNLVKWGGNTGQLVDSGLGIGSTTAWGMFYLNGSAQFATTGTGVNGQAMTSQGGGGSPPQFGAINLAGGSNIVTGTLPPGNGGQRTTNPTIQTFTSGSGTYTTPANVTWIKVRIKAGGGGGGGSGTTPGAATGGGNTTFGSSFLTANGGGAGPNGGGGSASGGDLNFTGQQGQPGDNNITFGEGGAPGGGPGAGVGVFQAAGGAAVPNSGGGGAGGGSSTTTGGKAGGGGEGGYSEKVIAGPNGTYSYAVGAAGNGGTAGTNGFAGSNGAAGYIIVEEHYNY